MISGMIGWINIWLQLYKKDYWSLKTFPPVILISEDRALTFAKNSISGGANRGDTSNRAGGECSH